MPSGLVVKNGSKIRVGCLRRQTGPAILDAHVEPAIIPDRSHEDGTPLGSHVGHRVHAVEDHVQQHLLQADAVPGDELRAGLKVGLDPHAPRPGGRRHERNDLSCDVVHVHCLGAQFVIGEQAPHPADDLARTTIVAPDVLDNRAQLRQIDRVGVEQQPRGLGIAQDRPERLVELVCERRGELAHGGASIEVGDLREVPPRFECRSVAPPLFQDEQQREKCQRYRTENRGDGLRPVLAPADFGDIGCGELDVECFGERARPQEPRDEHFLLCLLPARFGRCRGGYRRQEHQRQDCRDHVAEEPPRPACAAPARHVLAR